MVSMHHVGGVIQGLVLAATTDKLVMAIAAQVGFGVVTSITAQSQLKRT